MTAPSSPHKAEQFNSIANRARTLAAAAAIGGAALFLLFGYEFVRSASTSLYVHAYGSDRLAVVMALAPLGTLAILYFYGWLLSQIGPRRALLATSLLSGLGIAACYAGVRLGLRPFTGVLYVLREAYIVLLIEQYWSFINSTFVASDARKLNGPICGIASIGAIAGGYLVGRTAKPLGSETLLLFAAASLLPAAILAALAFRLGGEPAPTKTERQAHRGELALGLFLQNRTLLLLAILITCTQVVSTVLDLRFNGILQEAYPVKDERTAWSGNFYGHLNLVAFVFQFAVTPLLLRFCPLRLVHLAIPLVHLSACSTLLAHPTLFTSGLAFLSFKTLDYSVFRAGKEILYIPLSFDARYRAKQVIDAFVYRASKGGMSLLLAAAAQVFGRLPGLTYPLTAMTSALAWLFVVGRLTGKTTPDKEVKP